MTKLIKEAEKAINIYCAEQIYPSIYGFPEKAGSVPLSIFFKL